MKLSFIFVCISYEIKTADLISPMSFPSRPAGVSFPLLLILGFSLRRSPRQAAVASSIGMCTKSSQPPPSEGNYGERKGSRGGQFCRSPDLAMWSERHRPLSPPVIYASRQIDIPEQQWSDVHKISGLEGKGCLDARELLGSAQPKSGLHTSYLDDVI